MIWFGNLALRAGKCSDQKRKIKARAVWYDQMKAQIIEKPEGEEINKEEKQKNEISDSGSTPG